MRRPSHRRSSVSLTLIVVTVFRSTDLLSILGVVGQFDVGATLCRQGGEVNSPLREAFEAYGLGFTATTPAIRQSNIMELAPDLSARRRQIVLRGLVSTLKFCT